MDRIADKHAIAARVRALSDSQRRLLARRLDGTPQAASRHATGPDRLVGLVQLHGSATGTVTTEELADYLRARLPAYMVPGKLQLTEGFPRLPNGKVDRGALQSHPHTAPEREKQADDDLQGEFLQTLRSIWSEVLQTDEISLDDNFFELGGDSILSINVVSRAKKSGIQLQAGDLFDFPTLRQLTTYLESDTGDKAGEAGPDDEAELRTKNADGSRRPFFMVHGGSLVLQQLQSSLGPEQPIHLMSSHWESARIDFRSTIGDLAEEALAKLRKVQPEGPYLIGGFSIGCIIALELAQKLRRGGQNIGLLFLLDPPEDPRFFGPTGQLRNNGLEVLTPGTTAKPGRLQELRGIFKQEGTLQLLRRIRWLLPEYRARWPEFRAHLLLTTKNRISPRQDEPSQRHQSRASRVLRYTYARTCRRLGNRIPEKYRTLYVSNAYLAACKRYELHPFDAPIVMFRATRGQHKPGPLLWEAVCPEALTVHEYACDHLELLRDPDIVAQWTRHFADHIRAIRE